MPPLLPHPFASVFLLLPPPRLTSAFLPAFLPLCSSSLLGRQLSPLSFPLRPAEVCIVALLPRCASRLWRGEEKLGRRHTLTSTVVANPDCSYAIGVIHQGRMTLTPIRAPPPACARARARASDGARAREHSNRQAERCVAPHERQTCMGTQGEALGAEVRHCLAGGSALTVGTVFAGRY